MKLQKKVNAEEQNRGGLVILSIRLLNGENIIRELGMREAKHKNIPQSKQPRMLEFLKKAQMTIYFKYVLVISMVLILMNITMTKLEF